MIRLSKEDWARLKNSSEVAQKLENKWDIRVRTEIDAASLKDFERVSTGMPVEGPAFEQMLIRHWFECRIEAIKVAQKETELDKRAPRLAKRPQSLADILRQYDRWRKGLFKPKAIIKQAQDLKKRYIDAVQKAWKKHSEEFRHGGEQTQAEVRDLVRDAAKTTTARAQTIVRTETTRYYNKTRKDYYDASQDVVAYLFVAVRDKATTPWCRSTYVNGKRGRSGLVYKKGDPLLDSESPPCHWNCRSELLPLNRFNPSHLKLINDKTIQRRNHTCTALPPGWAA